MSQTKTIVSVTPVPLAQDSRTLKECISFARMGFRSIAVAAGRRIEVTPDFTLREGGAGSRPEPSAAGRGGRLHKMWTELRQGPARPLVHPLLFAAWTSLWYWRHTASVAVPPADLYWLHEFSGWPAVRRAAKEFGAPVIYDAHDFYTGITDPEDQPPFDRRWLNPFFKRTEGACIAGAQRTVTVSKGLAALLHETYGIEATVVHNAAVRPAADGTSPLKQRLGLGDDVFLAVVIGNRKPGQALNSALEALARLPDSVHIAFLGGGYEPLGQRAEHMGVGRRIHLLGAVPADRVAATAQGADAALILYYSLSRNYQVALPNGFFQGIAAGLPLLYPPLPEIAALAKAENLGLPIDPTDPASIAEGVRRLLTAPDERARLATNNRESGLTWAAEEAVLRAILSEAGLHPPLLEAR